MAYWIKLLQIFLFQLLLFMPLATGQRFSNPNQMVPFPWSCNFGSDVSHPQLCGLVQDQTDNFDWLPNYGRTPSDHTGPEPNSYQQHMVYMYLEATDREVGTRIRLISPTLPSTGVEKCLHFSYNVHGMHIGALNVLDQNGGVLWSHVGVKETNELLKNWLTQEVTLGASQRVFVIEGVRGGTSMGEPYGDICIDDFSVRPYACSGSAPVPPPPSQGAPDLTWPSADADPPLNDIVDPYGTCDLAEELQSCDFSASSLSSSCGFHNDATARTMWYIHQGPTSTAHTGPDSDHTNGTAAGRYIFLEASRQLSGSLPGYEARLISPDLRYQQGEPRYMMAPFCLQFWYHMYGSHVGSLSVYQYEDEYNPGSKRKIWGQAGNQGNAWQQGRITITESAWQIAIEAVHGGDPNNPDGTQEADIALDDIQLLWPSCENIDSCTDPTAPIVQPINTPWQCDFESDTCGFRDHMAPSGRYLWLRHTLETPTWQTGPSGDHTTANRNGYYMYAEATGANTPDVARLQSPRITYDTHFCVAFYYSLYGSGVGTLSFYVRFNSGQEDRLWYKTANQTERSQNLGWQRFSITVPASTVYLIFEAQKPSTDDRADIAIDDVALTLGSCPSSSSPHQAWPGAAPATQSPLQAWPTSSRRGSTTTNMTDGSTTFQPFVEIWGEETEPTGITGRRGTLDIGSSTTECEQGPGPCALRGNAVCQHVCEDQTDGTYLCSCLPGFTSAAPYGNCQDINECNTADVCPTGFVCRNVPGSHVCIEPDLCYPNSTSGPETNDRPTILSSTLVESTPSSISSSTQASGNPETTSQLAVQTIDSIQGSLSTQLSNTVVTEESTSQQGPSDQVSTGPVPLQSTDQPIPNISETVQNISTTASNIQQAGDGIVTTATNITEGEYTSLPVAPSTPQEEGNISTLNYNTDHIGEEDTSPLASNTQLTGLSISSLASNTPQATDNISLTTSSTLLWTGEVISTPDYNTYQTGEHISPLISHTVLLEGKIPQENTDTVLASHTTPVGENITPLVSTKPTVGENITSTVLNTSPVGENISPPASQTTPAGENISPPASQTTPVGENISPPASQTTPAGENISPPASQTTPAGEKISPPASQTTPVGENISPPASQTTPVGENISPPAFQTTAAGEIISPPASQTTPAGENISPPASQTTPVGENISPPASQTTPVGENISRPASQTTPAGENISPPASQTTPAGENIFPPASQTTPAGENISPQASQTTPAGENISPPASQTTPADENLSSPASQTASAGENISPPASQTTPAGENISPPASQTTPVGENISSPASQTTPTGENIYPTASQTTPAGENISPQASQTPPAGENISPPASQTTPAGENIFPPASQTTPAGENISLQASQTTPAGENISPPASQTTPVDDNISSPASQTTSAGENISPPASQTTPAGENISPPASQTTSAVENISPPASQTTPADDNISSPFSQTTSAGENISPPASQTTPAGENISPPASQTTSAGKTISPPASQTTPTGENISSSAPHITVQEEIVSPPISNTAPAGENITPPIVNTTPTGENITPPVVNTAPTWENITPSIANTAPTGENITPPMANTAPTWENITPPIANTAPTGENITPPMAITAPTGENITPSVSYTASPVLENITPPISNTAPTGENITPPVVNTAPTWENITPSIANTAPTGENITPPMAKTAPTGENITPPMANTAPTGENITPPMAITAPTGENITPPVSYTASQVWENITPQISNTAPTVENITPPMANTAPTGENITPPMANTAPTGENITPPMDITAATGENITPPVSYTASPVWENITPPISNTAPTGENITPPVVNTAPTWENITPSIANTAPTGENITPPMANTAPTGENITPPMANTAPTGENITPPMAITAPTGENITPPVSYTASPVWENITPPISNTAPTGENITPPIANTAPTGDNITPPMANTAPTGENITPPMAITSTAAENITPPIANTAPAGEDITPPVPNISPTGVSISPADASTIPAGSSISPAVPNTVVENITPAVSNTVLEDENIPHSEANTPPLVSDTPHISLYSNSEQISNPPNTETTEGQFSTIQQETVAESGAATTIQLGPESSQVEASTIGLDISQTGVNIIPTASSQTVQPDEELPGQSLTSQNPQNDQIPTASPIEAITILNISIVPLENNANGTIDQDIETLSAFDQWLIDFLMSQNESTQQNVPTVEQTSSTAKPENPAVTVLNQNSDSTSVTAKIQTRIDLLETEKIPPEFEVTSPSAQDLPVTSNRTVTPNSDDNSKIETLSQSVDELIPENISSDEITHPTFEGSNTPNIMSASTSIDWMTIDCKSLPTRQERNECKQMQEMMQHMPCTQAASSASEMIHGSSTPDVTNTTDVSSVGSDINDTITQNVETPSAFDQWLIEFLLSQTDDSPQSITQKQPTGSVATLEFPLVTEISNTDDVVSTHNVTVHETEISQNAENVYISENPIENIDFGTELIPNVEHIALSDIPMAPTGTDKGILDAGTPNTHSIIPVETVISQNTAHSVTEDSYISSTNMLPVGTTAGHNIQQTTMSFEDDLLQWLMNNDVDNVKNDTASQTNERLELQAPEEITLPVPIDGTTEAPVMQSNGITLVRINTSVETAVNTQDTRVETTVSIRDCRSLPTRSEQEQCKNEQNTPPPPPPLNTPLEAEHVSLQSESQDEIVDNLADSIVNNAKTNVASAIITDEATRMSMTTLYGLDVDCSTLPTRSERKECKQEQDMLEALLEVQKTTVNVPDTNPAETTNNPSISSDVIQPEPDSTTLLTDAHDNDMANSEDQEQAENLASTNQQPSELFTEPSDFLSQAPVTSQDEPHKISTNSILTESGLTVNISQNTDQPSELFTEPSDFLSQAPVTSQDELHKISTNSILTESGLTVNITQSPENSAVSVTTSQQITTVYGIEINCDSLPTKRERKDCKQEQDMLLEMIQAQPSTVAVVDINGSISTDETQTQFIDAVTNAGHVNEEDTFQVLDIDLPATTDPDVNISAHNHTTEETIVLLSDSFDCAMLPTSAERRQCEEEQARQSLRTQPHTTVHESVPATREETMLDIINTNEVSGPNPYSLPQSPIAGTSFINNILEESVSLYIGQEVTPQKGLTTIYGLEFDCSSLSTRNERKICTQEQELLQSLQLQSESNSPDISKITDAYSEPVDSQQHSTSNIAETETKAIRQNDNDEITGATVSSNSLSGVSDTLVTTGNLIDLTETSETLFSLTVINWMAIDCDTLPTKKERKDCTNEQERLLSMLSSSPSGNIELVTAAATSTNPDGTVHTTRGISESENVAASASTEPTPNTEILPTQSKLTDEHLSLYAESVSEVVITTETQESPENAETQPTTFNILAIDCDTLPTERGRKDCRNEQGRLRSMLSTSPYDNIDLVPVPTSLDQTVGLVNQDLPQEWTEHTTFGRSEREDEAEPSEQLTSNPTDSLDNEPTENTNMPNTDQGLTGQDLTAGGTEQANFGRPISENESEPIETSNHIPNTEILFTSNPVDSLGNTQTENTNMPHTDPKSTKDTQITDAPFPSDTSINELVVTSGTQQTTANILSVDCETLQTKRERKDCRIEQDRVLAMLASTPESNNEDLEVTIKPDSRSVLSESVDTEHTSDILSSVSTDKIEITSIIPNSNIDSTEGPIHTPEQTVFPASTEYKEIVETHIPIPVSSNGDSAISEIQVTSGNEIPVLSTPGFELPELATIEPTLLDLMPYDYTENTHNEEPTNSLSYDSVYTQASYPFQTEASLNYDSTDYNLIQDIQSTNLHTNVISSSTTTTIEWLNVDCAQIPIRSERKECKRKKEEMEQLALIQTEQPPDSSQTTQHNNLPQSSQPKETSVPLTPRPLTDERSSVQISSSDTTESYITPLPTDSPESNIPETTLLTVSDTSPHETKETETTPADTTAVHTTPRQVINIFDITEPSLDLGDFTMPEQEVGELLSPFELPDSLNELPVSAIAVASTPVPTVATTQRQISTTPRVMHISDMGILAITEPVIAINTEQEELKIATVGNDRIIAPRRGTVEEDVLGFEETQPSSQSPSRRKRSININNEQFQPNQPQAGLSDMLDREIDWIEIPESFPQPSKPTRSVRRKRRKRMVNVDLLPSNHPLKIYLTALKNSGVNDFAILCDRIKDGINKTKCVEFFHEMKGTIKRRDLRGSDNANFNCSDFFGDSKTFCLQLMQRNITRLLRISEETPDINDSQEIIIKNTYSIFIYTFCCCILSWN